MLTTAFVLLLAQVMHFMYIDMGLGQRGGHRYFQAHSARLGLSCVLFHTGTYVLAACFPLWAYRKFNKNDEVQPSFVVACVCAVGWVVYDYFFLLPAHAKINMLLEHAYMGIDAAGKIPKPSLPLFLPGTAQAWTEEGWRQLYQEVTGARTSGVETSGENTG